MQQNRFVSLLKKSFFFMIEDIKIVYYVGFFFSIIFLSSTAYYLLTPHLNGICIGGSAEKPVTFLNSIYFSLVTISSLGYGDINPIGFSKVLACFEVVIGLILMGIMLAKLTSARLSYHVERLFSSEIQKRLETFIEHHIRLKNRLLETTKLIGTTFQQTPSSTQIQNTQLCEKNFFEAVISFNGLGFAVADYLIYEIEHGNFFSLAPSENTIHTFNNIEQSLFLVGQMILTMTTEARTLLLNQTNRTHILDVIDKLKAACKSVENSCNVNKILKTVSRILKTCEYLHESFFSVPTTVPKDGQPDQALTTTDQPQ